MRKHKFHPLCKMFPELGKEQLQQLADDIRENGLQNPIIMLDGKVLDGRNRLKACEHSGVKPRFKQWDGKGSVLDWVISQNLVRRHLSSSQRAVLALDLLPHLQKEAKARQRLSHGRGQKGTETVPHLNGEATEFAARMTKSNSRYVKIAKQISEVAPDVINRIRSGEVNIMQAKRMATIEEKKAKQQGPKTTSWTVTADQSVVKCDLLLVDPPYGITQESWEPKDVQGFTKEWCQRWSKCGSDFIAVFWSQEMLFEGRQWFDDSLDGYKFQQMLVWHAQNNGAMKSRQMLKRTWEPIFLYRRTGSTKKIIDDETQWVSDMTNMDCHVTFVPQKNYNGHNYRQHPCQKPVSVMRWLINALSRPGERVVSPFCGVTPCGIAAVQLGRQYRGIEKLAEYRKIAKRRITTYGTESPSGD